MTVPNRKTRRAQQQARRRLKVGPIRSPFASLPPQEWPTTASPHGLRRVHKSDALIVMECARPGNLTLLMIQRLDARDGLTWDDLQWVKGALGYGDREALEMYPREDLVVNVANIRHLWMLPEGEVMQFGLDPDRARSGLVVPS